MAVLCILVVQRAQACKRRQQRRSNLLYHPLVLLHLGTNFSADTQLQHLLNFLNLSVQTRKSVLERRHAPLHPSDNDDTDSMLSSRTSVSARTSAANSAAGSDQNDIFESTETDMNRPHPNSSSSSSAAPASASASTREKDRSSARIPTARARRRDSVDGMIANFVPDIVSAKMTQLKKEKEQLQRRLENERKRWQSDSRQIRSVLQQRYEGLMTAAERDRERLERQITELELKNKSLEQGIEQLQLQQRREAETPQPSHSDISSAAKEAAAAATITATQTINVLTEKNGKLGEQLSALENRLRVESLAREEAQSAVVRMEREVKRLGESRDREVMLREVAETAVFEAESEIERHRVLYSKERQKRKRLGDKLSFYRQLEQRLKNSAADSTSERIQWLFDEQQQSEATTSGERDGARNTLHPEGLLAKDQTAYLGA